jgi:transposase-like protein
MKQHIEIRCRYCGTDDLAKNGRSENGMQRYRCGGCGRSFQHEYKYNAWKPGVKEQIEKQTLNSSRIRDISGNLNISPNTVVSELKKNSGGSEFVFYAAAGRSRGRNKNRCGGRRIMELFRKEEISATDLVRD